MYCLLSLLHGGLDPVLELLVGEALLLALGLGLGDEALDVCVCIYIYIYIHIYIYMYIGEAEFFQTYIKLLITKTKETVSFDQTN